MTVFQFVIMENFMPETSPYIPHIGTSLGAIHCQNAKRETRKLEKKTAVAESLRQREVTFYGLTP